MTFEEFGHTFGSRPGATFTSIGNLAWMTYTSPFVRVVMAFNQIGQFIGHVAPTSPSSVVMAFKQIGCLYCLRLFFYAVVVMTFWYSRMRIFGWASRLLCRPTPCRPPQSRKPPKRTKLSTVASANVTFSASDEEPEDDNMPVLLADFDDDDDYWAETTWLTPTLRCWTRTTWLLSWKPIAPPKITSLPVPHCYRRQSRSPRLMT